MFDAHPAQEVAGGDVNSAGILVGTCHGLVADTADDCSSCHNVLIFVIHDRVAQFIFRLQSSSQTFIHTSFWDIQQVFVMNG